MRAGGDGDGAAEIPCRRAVRNDHQPARARVARDPHRGGRHRARRLAGADDQHRARVRRAAVEDERAVPAGEARGDEPRRLDGGDRRRMAGERVGAERGDVHRALTTPRDASDTTARLRPRLYAEPPRLVRARAVMDGQSLPETWTDVVTDPAGFYAKMPETGGLGRPTAFLAACAGVHAAGHLLLGGGFRGLVGVFAIQLVGTFLVAVVAVLVAQHLFGGRAGFEPTFRALAYGAAPTVFSWLPLVGTLAALYAAYLAVRGLERVHAYDATRAVLTLLVSVVAVALVLPRAGCWR